MACLPGAVGMGIAIWVMGNSSSGYGKMNTLILS